MLSERPLPHAESSNPLPEWLCFFQRQESLSDILSPSMVTIKGTTESHSFQASFPSIFRYPSLAGRPGWECTPPNGGMMSRPPAMQAFLSVNSACLCLPGCSMCRTRCRVLESVRFERGGGSLCVCACVCVRLCVW